MVSRMASPNRAFEPARNGWLGVET